MNTDREHGFYHVLIRVTLSGAAAGTVVALFSRWFWIAELFSHFRVYYLLALILLALTFFWTSHRYLLMLSIALAIPNAWYVWPYLSPVINYAQAAERDADALHIVAHNLKLSSPEFGAALNYLQRSDADILILAEFTRGWRAALVPLEATYPHRVQRPRTHPWGMAIYSRVPLLNLEQLQLTEHDNVQFHFTLSVSGRPVELFAVHLFSPVKPGFAHRRNQQLEELAALVSASKHPALVVGDMNITPFSPYFAEFLSKSGLQDTRRRWGFHITWPTHPIPLWIPIDHCLAAPELNVASVDRGPNIGSDHYPLEIRVGGSSAADTI